MRCCERWTLPGPKAATSSFANSMLPRSAGGYRGAPGRRLRSGVRVEGSDGDSSDCARARRRALCSPQSADRSRLRPLSDVAVEPGHGVLAKLPALRELAGDLEAVDRHAGQSGELHYLPYAEELHVDISCDVPLRPELTADARGQSLVQFPR